MLSLDVFADILQFSSRSAITQSRLLCRQVNALLLQHPSLFKQRLHFPQLVISTNPGLLDAAIDWPSLPAFKQCCQDNTHHHHLQAMALSLVGRRLIPDEEDNDDDVVVRLWISSSPPIQMLVPNLLTHSSAFDLLHMLQHLSKECSFEGVLIEEGIHINASSSSIHCHRLEMTIYDEVEGLLPMITSPSTSLFKVHEEVVCDLGLGHVGRAIRVLHRSNHQQQQPMMPVTLQVYCNEREELDEAMEFLHSHDLAPALNKVKLGVWGHGEDGHWRKWPMAPLDSMEAVEGEELVFKRTNRRTEREYRVLLELSKEGGEVEWITIQL